MYVFNAFWTLLLISEGAVCQSSDVIFQAWGNLPSDGNREQIGVGKVVPHTSSIVLISCRRSIPQRVALQQSPSSAADFNQHLQFTKEIHQVKGSRAIGKPRMKSTGGGEQRPYRGLSGADAYSAVPKDSEAGFNQVGAIG